TSNTAASTTHRRVQRCLALSPAGGGASASATANAVVSGRHAANNASAGIGSAMAANKVAGARAASCYDATTARNSREHNDANVLTLGSRLLTPETAREVLRVWLETEFAGGRHQRRIDKIVALERRD
ncbi:MAG: RpiB/LacA/LacB family sugar-phosphate isomerase, partial [Acidobacteria bacterium]|nr:RpiB/LacA/LacB family sugar-phosphate isomerase [Acidobacteriota bacterium]